MDELDELLRAVANTHRRRILQWVWHDELGVGALAELLELAAPSVSEHLKVLRKTGLVEMRVSGTYRLYRAAPQRVADLVHLLHQAFPVSRGDDDDRDD